MKIQKITSIFLLLFCFQFNSIANNIQVSNVTLTDLNVYSKFVMIQMDLTWENSFRVNNGANNWDAAWIFVKYRINGGIWNHAFLGNSGNIAGSGTEIAITPGLVNTSAAHNETTNPVVGVFVYRNNPGYGNLTQNGLKIRWNYGANGINFARNVELKVFAIEMVYVPSGSFSVGDGTEFPYPLNGQLRDAATNIPFVISSENQITLGDTISGNIGNNNSEGMFSPDDFNDLTTKILPAAFPKGFNSFYCMKYEVTQQLWIDFFNTLTQTQKTRHDITSSNGKNNDLIIHKNNIRWTSGDATLNGGTHGNVACNYLNWIDATSFLDWAGLRPMSELEFEKACRGPELPILGEYAWGTSEGETIIGYQNNGLINEIASNSTSNVNNSAVLTQIFVSRVGMFAKSNTTRVNSGATFYGIMDMSGNVYEPVVTLGRSAGRIFTHNNHGDGLLTVDGFSDISTWPGFVTNKITSAAGSGFRGGGYESSYSQIRVSDRKLSSVSSTTRFREFGLRGIRSAP